MSGSNTDRMNSLPLQVRVIPQHAHHVGVGRLPAAARLLDLLVLDLGPLLDDLVLVGGDDSGALQLLLDGLLVWDLDLLPDLPELVVEVLDQRRVVGPDHLRMVVLLVPRHQELPFLLELVDRLLHVRPPLPELADAHARARGLRLELFEELLRGANVVRRPEAEGALAVGAAGIVLHLVVHLQDASQGLDVALVVCAVLQGEVGDDVGELERHAFRLHVLDREDDLRHDVLARAGIRGL